jgi:signal transduction histidine kinase
MTSRPSSRFANRLSFIWYNDRSFTNILKHAAALPPHSALFWHLMNVDAAGVVHEGDTGLPRLYEVANAPIFTFDDSFFGREIVGGPMHSVLGSSRDTAAVVIRILGGEKAGDIKIAARGYSPPIFDWRLMQRWGISERNLPPGSKIFFREPSAWQRYQMAILAIVAAILFQTGLIAWLIYEHRRRHYAELKTRQRTAELARINRRSVAGEMSASIAHELNQPLTAILSNAEVAHDLLGRENHDPAKIREIVADIIEEDTRAANVIDRIRQLLRKGESKSDIIDLNELIESTLHLLRGELVKRKTNVETALAADLPAIVGDSVQLQQVLLNLLINAIDAVGSKTPPRRMINISTRVNGKHVEVDITDSGHGIRADDQKRVFEPFFTTKEQGLGLGLSICSTIVNAHNGKLSIQNNDRGGATAALILPSARATDRAIGKPNLAANSSRDAPPTQSHHEPA